MEIKNVNNRIITAYKNVAGSPVKPGRGKTPEMGKSAGDNFDKVEFNFGNSMSAAKADIAGSIAANAETGRIESLQTSYVGDNNPVTSEKIAETIVD